MKFIWDDLPKNNNFKLSPFKQNCLRLSHQLSEVLLLTFLVTLGNEDFSYSISFISIALHIMYILWVNYWRLLPVFYVNIGKYFLKLP